MKTKEFDQLAGKTIRSAKIQVATENSNEGDELDLVFTDGSTFTLDISPVQPHISFAVAEDEHADYVPVPVYRGQLQ